MKIVLNITNDFVTDQRINRIAESLTKAGHHVSVIGRKTKLTKPLKKENFQVYLLNMVFTKGAKFYAAFNIRLFFRLLYTTFDVVIANDLDTLPASYFAAKIKNKKIVYDSHEYFTEVPELVHRPTIRKIWELIEKKLVPNVDRAYTVCNSIASVYSEKYNQNFEVIRNVPVRNKPVIVPPKEHFTWPANPVILYQGAVNMGRGLEQMIQTMAYLDNITLVIIGTGTIIEDLKKLVVDLDMQNKVLIPGRIEKEFLPYYTKKAAIGISLEEDLGLSYRYALPNKLFDYIQAGIPILVSDLPEMKNIVEKYAIGTVLKHRQPDKIAAIIKNMIEDKELNKGWKKNLSQAGKELCWENESEKLIRIFKSL